MLNSTTKTRIQSFGRFLANMILPNIGAFIAWGFLTALFLPSGWFPNASFATLIDPILTYLLPILIGYTGGKLLGGERGGTVGSIATLGAIVGAEMPMLLGAMIAGPIGGWTIRRIDKLLENRVKSGFEMLVANFSAGITGILLALLAMVAIGPAASGLSTMLADAVKLLVDNNLLPLTSLFVEPAKVLFLNNAINHGVLSPLSMLEVKETGYSILFLIEANPGPGLGVLLAYSLYGQGINKHSAPGAMVIQFFGGIHEVYFPYILMNPRLVFAVIAGGASGVATLSMLNAGLVAPASPGSIISILAMTPKASFLGVVLAIAVSTAVSFVIASILVKHTYKANNDTTATAMNTASTVPASPEQTPPLGGAVLLPMTGIKKITVVAQQDTDAGLHGASLLKHKALAMGLELDVQHVPIEALLDDTDLVIAEKRLTERAISQSPSAKHVFVADLAEEDIYNQLIKNLANGSVG
ncbi:PTS mannitol transporter subunit IICBA [Corallincola spongiicola]|uniref:PTS mannitol transporter subunit IICBA n=1 Tax=Corallincola spongiicola TaxID=2520508 RepID=A0ABY1WPR1_9GAMM|nr:PTS mannitol transporter subunit IICBA [Corallincola spongiicola]TAA45982.1 PTS mannitol transporter subunit IICBA [Corallincola spongiicola]